MSQPGTPTKSWKPPQPAHTINLPSIHCQALWVLSPPSLVSLQPIPGSQLPWQSPSIKPRLPFASFLVSYPHVAPLTSSQKHTHVRAQQALWDSCTPRSSLGQAKFCVHPQPAPGWVGREGDHAMWPQPAPGPAPGAQEGTVFPEVLKPPERPHPPPSLPREMRVPSGCAGSGALVTHPSENGGEPQT